MSATSYSRLNSTPLVTVVIPTLHRPELVCHAVQTALQQSFQDLEVIVVVDGPDPATVAALSRLDDARLRVLVNSQNQGCAGSRIRGIAAARGEWIASLDDDDGWKPRKLEKQLAMAHASPHRWPVISCLCEVEFDNHREIWPRRLPKIGEPISEYLFIRNSLFQGEGLLQSSTLLVPKALYELAPLNLDYSHHDDWDWIVMAASLPGVDFRFVAEPMAQWNLKTSHSHTSSPECNRWQGSRSWIRSRRDRLTPRAYAAFLLTEVASRAAAAGAWPAFFTLLWEACWQGQPNLKMLFLYLGMWLFPGPLRQFLRRFQQQWFNPNELARLSSLSPPLSPPACSVASIADTTASANMAKTNKSSSDSLDCNFKTEPHSSVPQPQNSLPVEQL